MALLPAFARKTVTFELGAGSAELSKVNVGTGLLRSFMQHCSCTGNEAMILSADHRDERMQQATKVDDP
jgi:hypothetical protein